MKWKEILHKYTKKIQITSKNFLYKKYKFQSNFIYANIKKTIDHKLIFLSKKPQITHKFSFCFYLEWPVRGTSNIRIQILYNGDPFENFGHNPNAGRSSSSLSLLSPRVNKKSMRYTNIYEKFFVKKIKNYSHFFFVFCWNDQLSKKPQITRQTVYANSSMRMRRWVYIKYSNSNIVQWGPF